MKSFTRYLNLFISTERGFLNITPQVEEALAESGIQEGLCLVKTKPDHALLGDI